MRAIAPASSLQPSLPADLSQTATAVSFTPTKTAALATPAPTPGSLEAMLQAFLQVGSPSRQLTAALHLGENAIPEELRTLLENAHRFPANAAIAALLKRWLSRRNSVLVD